MFENLSEENISRIYEKKNLEKDSNNPKGDKDIFEICVGGAKKIAQDEEKKNQLRNVIIDRGVA